MSRYIVQLRRGTKAEWEDYQASDKYIRPKEAELVIEYEDIYDASGNHIKRIPRLKIGDGITDYDQLPYMSVDSFVLPTPAMIHLSTDWIQDADNRYYQVVTVQNAVITINSKVDLLPDALQLSVFHQKDLTFVTENEDGVVKVYCVGQVPQNEYDIRCTVTEVGY